MVITILEANVPPDKIGLLQERFTKASSPLPSAIVETFLLQAAGTDLWRIETVWVSQEALDAYRTSVDTPEGVLMFRAAGAEPSLTIFQVKEHAGHRQPA
jgi:hypothetical protein